MRKLKNNQILNTEIRNEDALQIACEILSPQVFLLFEPNAFNTAKYLSENYDGGLWSFHKLSNGGFFMAPPTRIIYKISCPNEFEGECSSQTFGLIICLYIYSFLSTVADSNIKTVCSKQYHCLLEYARELPTYQKILNAID